MMNRLSIAIITKNEEKNIARCLESVQWADEIVVVDSGSTDETVKICKKYNCIIYNSEWLGFGKTKQFAIDKCTNNWVFSLDADEIVTPGLKIKIEKLLEEPAFYGYRIKRSSYYLGKMIQHCGWNKDYTLRLFDKSKGKFNQKIVHESVEITDGKIGKMEELILHYTYPKVQNHISKMTIYAQLGAEQDFAKGKKSTISKAVFSGIYKFVKMFILQKGFLDGKYGFLLSYNSAFGVFLKYLYLWEIINEKS
jgi:glycosyltransferase involved in cell wall biosynthesis